MDTAGFLQRVVAPTDNIVISALKPGLTRKDDRFWNVRNCITVEDAVSAIQFIDSKPALTVYFAVGTHANNVEAKPSGGTKILRRQATASRFRALALDLDCGEGKPYATQKEGVRALLGALRTFSFPDPMLVNSGNGVHCYWPLIDDIPALQWERVSIALRLALNDGGVIIDWGKIHDTSMVLRPVGSHHKKQQPWKEVVLVRDAPDYDIVDLETRLAQWIGKTPPRQKSSSGKNTATVSSPIAAAILNGSFDSLNLPIVASQCRQLAALIASGGAVDAMGNNVAEPMWRGSLGVAKYTEDQQAAVIALCGKHPTFNLQENLDKLDAWSGTGVTTCAYFEQYCPGGCNGCPSKGSIKSPAALSIATELHVTSTAMVEGQAVNFSTVTPLPPPYHASNGKVWMTVEVERNEDDPATGKKVKKLRMENQKVCDYPLVVMDRYTDPVHHEKTNVVWAAKYPVTGWRSFDMPMDALSAGGADLMKYFGNKQIFIENETLLHRLRRYMTTYLGYIQENRQSGLELGAFGWQPDGSFLCGEKLQNVDGTTTSWKPNHGLKIMAAKVKTAGTLAAWTAMTKQLDDPCAHHISFSMLIAGCGLLLPGSGIQSFVYSLHSPTTGTGKSLALLAGNSMFGHPTELLLQPSDTQNALFQIMGMLGSLSASMDEITTMTEERAALFAFDAQTGREKMRLTQDAKLREGTKWHAPLRVTTNISLFSMYDLVKNTNEAERVRTFEILVDDKAFINKHDVQTLARLLTDNHGWVVPLIAAEITKRGGVRTVYDYYAAQFAQKFAFKFVGDERFYAGGVISAYGFGCLCHELGLILFDPAQCTQWALDHAATMRRVRDNSRQDSFDVLGQFLSEYNNQIVIMKEDSGGKPTVQMPIPDIAVARLELVCDKTLSVKPGSKLMVNTGKLRDWLRRGKGDVNNLIHGLQKEGALINDKERVTLYKGTHHNNPGQAFCIVIDMMHPRFASVLSSNKAIVTTNPSLAILQGGKP